MVSCIHMMKKLENISGIQVSIVCCLLAMLATNLAFSSSRFGYCFSLVVTYMYTELLHCWFHRIKHSFLLSLLVLCPLMYIVTHSPHPVHCPPKRKLTFLADRMLNLYRRCPLAFYKKLRVSDKVGSLIYMLLKNEDSNSHCVCYSILVEKPWVKKSDELLPRYMSMLLA